MKFILLLFFLIIVIGSYNVSAIPISLFNVNYEYTDWYYGYDNEIGIFPTNINGEIIAVDSIKIFITNPNLLASKTIHRLSNNGYRFVFKIFQNTDNYVFLNVTVSEQNKIISEIVEIPIKPKAMLDIEKNHNGVVKFNNWFKTHTLDVILFMILACFVIMVIVTRRMANS